MMGRPVVTAFAAAALLAGCGEAHPLDQEKAGDLPRCSSILAAGKVIPSSVTTSGCTDSAGKLQAVPFFACKDGSHLVVFNGVHGKVGAKAVAGDGNSEAGGKALFQCTSG